MIEIYGLKNTFGHIRIDSRWTLEDCMHRLKKSERVVKFQIKQVPCVKLCRKIANPPLHT